VLILRHVPSRRSRRRTSAGREALAARGHRQSAGRETRMLELRVSHRLSAHVAGAELSARDGRPAAEVRVMHRQVHVRESRTGPQRSKAAAVVIAEPDSAEASAISAPPGMETVTRSKRQPADPAPATETKPESTAKAEERNICRRPDRTVERISVCRPRPPSPTAVNLHPSAVVIRRPSPGIIRNPGPSPIRLIHPAAIAIRSPASRFGRPPHWTVIRNFSPGAMGIEIFGPYVIVVSALPRYRIADHVVAIRVPLIPIIPGRCFADLVLLLIAGALHRDELARSHARAALRSRNFYFASADEDFGVIVGSNQNSKAGFASLGANGNVGRIDLCVRIAVLVHGVVRHAVSKLNLDLRARELRDVGLRMLSQAEHVGIVELKLSAPFVAGRNAVTREHGSVEHSRGPVFRIATLCRNIAMNQTDARHAASLRRSRCVGSRVARACVVRSSRRTLIHRALVVRALIIRTLTHRALVVRSLLHGTLIVGTRHRRLRRRLNVRRRFRILIRHLVVRILSEDHAWTRDHQSHS